MPEMPPIVEEPAYASGPAQEVDDLPFWGPGRGKGPSTQNGNPLRDGLPFFISLKGLEERNWVSTATYQSRDKAGLPFGASRLT